jgi:hypothetical protein
MDKAAYDQTDKLVAKSPSGARELYRLRFDPLSGTLLLADAKRVYWCEAASYQPGNFSTYVRSLAY